MSDSTGPQISFTASIGDLAKAWREGYDVACRCEVGRGPVCIANPYDPTDKGDCGCDVCMPWDDDDE